eukprot:gene63781-87234_t
MTDPADIAVLAETMILLPNTATIGELLALLAATIAFAVPGLAQAAPKTDLIVGMAAQDVGKLD